MTLPSDSFARITCRMTSSLAPRPAFVVFCVENGTEKDLATIAAAAKAAFANLSACMTSDWSYVETNVKLGPDATGAQASFAGSAHVGTTNPPTATPQVAYLLNKNTALGGRRNRGRMYIPGVKESYVGPEGALDGTATTILTAGAGDFLADLATSLMPLHLEHDPATTWVLVGGQPRRVPTGGAVPAPTEVTSISVNPVVATQRRRLR